jgi:RNase P subunit RPR2
LTLQHKERCAIVEESLRALRDFVVKLLSMSARDSCELCDRPLPPHGHYIVRIDVFADPEMPPISSEELAEADYQQAMRELIEQMKDMSADDLQDQVHRRFEFKLCRACQMRFLVNPLGKPRQRRMMNN